MPVAFEELDGSPKIQITPENTTAQRRFKIAWTDWQAFARELVGYYRTVGTSTTFTAPKKFPGGPANLVAQNLTIDGFPASKPGDNPSWTSLEDQGPNDYQYAIVTATYNTISFGTSGDARSDLPGIPDGTLLTYSQEMGVEYMSIPDGVWKWNITGKPALEGDVSPGIVIPTSTHVLTWERVLLPPYNQIRAKRGKINSAVFLGSGIGTMLFTGARISRQFQFMEEGGFWTVEYFFSENSKKKTSDATTEVGWNYFYRAVADGGEHWLPIENAAGVAPYHSTTFTELFAFGTV